MAIPTFIDLFCGIGGFRLAFEAHAAKCVFSSDIDKFARQTYEANFGDIPAGDIYNIAANSIPDFDILTAGFPCQPFSEASINLKISGMSGFKDGTRGTLFFEIARILAVKKPAAFLLENVAGLMTHDDGRTWQVIYDVLTEVLGYHIYWKIIDGQVAVPQRRKRIYIVGFREDNDHFEWPTFPRRTVLLRDVIEKTAPLKYRITKRRWEYYQTYRSGPGTFRYRVIDPWSPPYRKVTATLHSKYQSDSKNILIPRGENKRPRTLMPIEAKRLMGFPESFIMPPTISNTQAFRQYGNSVVVPVVTAIAGQLILALRQKERATFR